jgi:hypothetical protein
MIAWKQTLTSEVNMIFESEVIDILEYSDGRILVDIETVKGMEDVIACFGLFRNVSNRFDIQIFHDNGIDYLLFKRIPNE